VRKGFVPILILIGIVIIISVVGGAYYFSKKSLNPTATNPAITKVLSSPITTTAPDETTIWKTYKNEKHNYSISYPPSFELLKGSVPISELSKLDNVSFLGWTTKDDPYALVELSIEVLQNNVNGAPFLPCISSDDCLRKQMSYNHQSPSGVSFMYKNIMGKNVRGYQLPTNRPDSKNYNINQIFIFPANGKIWTIGVSMNNYSPEKVNPLIDQILSTFKFTN